ncbi:MAG TPA: Fe-Mn family superoxide dismutase [Nitrospiraceae bacterium]|nr:Fe-Mn family superoxide dismutase [Nitrospiraceae bacterium]
MYAITSTPPYRVQSYDLHGLNGISDKTMQTHFKLYEGYVKETNNLTEHIRDFLKDGKVDQEELPAYSELKRRLGFEYNGMVLHEYYFDNLKSGGSGDPVATGLFRKATDECFGSFETWKVDFVGVGKMRGVGWAICYLNPNNGRISNHWITLHEIGNVAGFTPVLVMDAWEHAFILDYKPSERGAYIDAFFSNIDWKTVDERLTLSKAPATPATV